MIGEQSVETMTTSLFSEEHEIFRATARRYFERECLPYAEEWEKRGIVDREAWTKAAEYGVLCMTVDPAYGGAGVDALYPVILLEEQVRTGAPPIGLSVHSDIVAPYIELYGSERQKQRCLPRMAAGEWIGAIAMSEPSTGSDLRAVQTTARRVSDGYLINGRKTFITNGHLADLIVLVARTDNEAEEPGISLFLIETNGLAGLQRGRKLDKIGQKASDTAELFFDDVLVPHANLLGEREGRGFAQLMDRLVYERLLTGVVAVASMEKAVSLTTDYAKVRHAFGRPILHFQNTRFKLAESLTLAAVARSFLNKCIGDYMRGELSAEKAAMLKWWTTEQQCHVVDECLQLHGGYGYMREFPIARLWADSRVAKIYAGTNEIMKEVIGRAL